MPPRILRSALLALLLAAVVPAAASAAPTATFTQRFSANDSGNIAIAANTLMSCPASANGCTSATHETDSVAGVADNDFNMEYVNTADGGGMFDSSTATLTIPNGATVLFAGLYWGARTGAGTGGHAAPNAGAKNVVKLRAPSGAYQTVTATGAADVVDTDAYQHFADVTAKVAAGGSGLYAVGDVQAGTGADHYAGWSLVVAYRDLNQPPRNLSVFDGLTVVKQADPAVDINVSGFTTAPSGPVKTTLGAVAYEGDLGKTGDGMKLRNTALSNAANPVDDFFNSSVSVGGTRTLTGRDPAQENHLGFDADLISADGILANSATSATITVNTAAQGGETIYPGVLTFASELLAAKVRPALTVSDLNGGNAEPGDILEYTDVAENTGNGAASGLQLKTTLPAGVELVPDSLELVEDAVTGGQTPQAGDDRATYDPTTRTVTWNVGAGATPAAGGTVAAGAKVRVRYRVRIGTPADGAALATTSSATYGTVGTSDQFTVSGSGGSVSASSPDLALDITRAGALVSGGAASYDIAVTNVASAPARGLVRVTDTLPAALTADGTPSGAGWTCSVSGQLVTCDRSDALAPGAYPVIHVPVRVAQHSSGAIVNAATASNDGDGSHGNDSDSDDAGLPAVRSALSLALTRDPATIAPGDTATITATVTSGGPSDAAGVQVDMPLPSGLELVSAHTGAQACVGTVCPVGTVTAGHDATAVYVVRAIRAAAGTSQSLTATSTSAVTDSTTGDDSATVAVAVREQRLVSVTQSVDPDPLVAGAATTLDLEVHNAGPSTATGVVLREPLPAQLHDATADIDAADGTCAITAGALRCDLAPMADGARVPVTVHATVASDAAGAALDLTASVDAVTGDPVASDDTVTVHRTVDGRADLSVTSVDAPATLRAGERGGWTLRVTNDGSGDATGTALRFPLPTGTTLAGATGAACSTLAGVVTCTIGSLVTGAHVDITVTLAAAATAPAGAFTLAAEAGANEPDPDSADARVDVPGTLVREADLAVTQTGPATVVAGTPATYTATIVNHGPADANGVVVTVAVPSGLTGATATVRGGHGTCTVASGAITCRVGGLAVGERVVIDVTGTVARTAGGRSFDAVVRAHADEADADTTDNEATQRTGAGAVSDVSVNAFAPAGTVAAGAQAQVTLTAHNDGPSDADDVVLTTTLPAAAQAIDLDPRCTVTGRTATCRLGTVAVGADSPVVIKVRATRAFSGALLGAGAGVSTSGRDPQPANDSLAQMAEEPIRCTSRRMFTIHLRLPAAARLKSVAVKVGGKPVRVRVGRRLTAVVDLRSRPAGRIVVQIHAVTRAGQQIVGTRAYQTCKVKLPTVKPPRI